MDGLRHYFCEFSLDPNTTHRELRLSDNNRTVAHEWEDQHYPDHQDRFRDHHQVLSSTGLTGSCYWEVDWSGEWWGVDIAVSYRGIRRRGHSEDCSFGNNDQSWSLRVRDGRYSVWHNKKETPVSSSSSLSGRAAVFLDSEAGSLSFYEVLSGGKLSHLHTFSSTFSEPLFPGFGLGSGSSVSLVDVRTQRPPVDRP